MTQDLRQDDFEVQMVGEVKAPPAIEDILFLIKVGAETKAGVNLTAGEARILNDYLKENR